MRLSEHTQHAIHQVVREIIGKDAAVVLFGSRVDDSARGGDIDLLILSDQPVTDRSRKALQIVARLQRRLGDQPIDVLILDSQTKHLPVHEQALKTGVRL